MDYLSEKIGKQLAQNRKEHFKDITKFMKQINQQDNNYIQKTKTLLDRVNSCNALMD